MLVSVDSNLERSDLAFFLKALTVIDQFQFFLLRLRKGFGSIDFNIVFGLMVAKKIVIAGWRKIISFLSVFILEHQLYVYYFYGLPD